MPCRELRRPDLLVGAGGVGVLPDVAYIQRVRYRSCLHFFAEKTVEQVFVGGKKTLREHWVAELLKFLHDFVIQAGIVAIGASDVLGSERFTLDGGFSK